MIFRSPSQQIVQPVQVVILFSAAMPAAVDTLLTMIAIRDGVPGPGATSFGVTAGTILRIRTVVFSMRTTAAFSPAGGNMTLRTNPVGATVLASQALFNLHCFPSTSGASTIGNSGKVESLPPSFMFRGTQTIGVSAVGDQGIVANVVNISLIGDELPDWITE